MSDTVFLYNPAAPAFILHSITFAGARGGVAI